MPIMAHTACRSALITRAAIFAAKSKNTPPRAERPTRGKFEGPGHKKLRVLDIGCLYETPAP
jgi:hypothetical protein